jgi:hypothetical protein
MRVAILVGFCYKNGVEEYLPGVTIDLYLMYKLALRAKMDTVIVTDIDEAEPTEILTEAIIDEIADRDLYTFMERTQEQRELFRGKQWLEKRIGEISDRASDILFYYSGHADNGNFILPSLERMKMDSLLDYLDRPCRALIVTDCCNGDSWNLPYRYKKRFRLVAPPDRRFIEGNVLVLSASKEGESSYASRRGSSFTRSLAKCLGLCGVRKGARLTLEQLINLLQQSYRDSTVAIHSSYPGHRELWGWILGRSLDISIRDCWVSIRKE